MYESLNKNNHWVLGSGAEGMKTGVKDSPMWLDAMGEAEIPGVAIGWCCEVPLRLSARIKTCQMRTGD